MTVAESTTAAPTIGFASNLGTSGTPSNMTAVTVPAGSTLVCVGGSQSSLVSNITLTDSGSRLSNVLTYNGSFGVVVAKWFNNTGSSVSVTPIWTATYSSNKAIAYGAYLISGSDGSATISATMTNASTPQISATPSIVGSLFCLHYFLNSPTANVSSFVTGSTVDTSPAGTAVGNTGSNEVGLGTIYQSSTNSQTSSPVTVGAAAPTSSEAYGILVEYRPPGTGGFTGVVGTAAAAGIPGTFTGSIPGGFTGVRGTAAAAGIVGTFSGGSAPQPVTESTIRAVAISFASNFSASGTTSSFGTYSVPAGSSIVVVTGANDSNVTSLVVSDAAGHTWRRLVGYNPSSMPLAVDLWHNDTGATQLLDVQLDPTYTFNKTIGLAAYIIANCGASPIVAATLTGSTTTADLSATPTTVGSLLVLHYVQQQPSAIVSAFETGTTGDTTAGGYGVGNSGTDKMGIGTLYQTTPNTQTSSPVAVGATAPSATTYAALIEYLPSASSTGQGFAGKNGHAAAAGIPGLFQGTLFVGALAHAAATGAPGTFEGTTIISGPLATATAHGIPGTFTGTVFQSGAFPGAVGRVAAPGIPGVFTAGDLWTGATGTATARGIPGTFSSNVTPTRNITITIGLITGSWSGAAPIGGWTSGVDQISGWAVGTAESGWSAGGITG